MFKKQDFKKIDLLGSGKKHTKIYKVIHIQSNKTYALKEIEAKTLDKLNEYKEEAVQLAKIQNHPNIIKFFGYYFSETMYNTFRLGLITEYMDHTRNLENIYRKRKKQGIKWNQEELVSFTFSLISSCSFLQQRGICHRDIKPANIFVLENNECKLIDFGESKDYFYDPDDEDRNTYTVATIRGTPQYLSPLLWKAHVIDQNSRYVEHNIYKSDVFSCGLVLCQMALMQEVNGFNNKTQSNDGEQIVRQALQDMESFLSPQVVNIIALMLIFEESNRPSFTEIEQLFIEHENQALKSDPQNKQKKLNDFIKIYNQKYNTLSNKNQEKKPKEDKKQQQQSQNQNQNFEKQAYQKSHIYWFEFGGNSIGKFSIQKQRWKTKQIPDTFPPHFTTLYVPSSDSYYLLGGPAQQNFRMLQNDTLQFCENQMPSDRNFFPAVYFNSKIYVFGGYHGRTKSQLKSCEFYDLKSKKWNGIQDLTKPRSQACACKLNQNDIVIMGGYNKGEGTLRCIERYIVKENRFEIIQGIQLPIPLRRFGALRIRDNVLLVFGGQTTQSCESQKVFQIDFNEMKVVELQNLEKGGVIETESLVDNDDYIHLFLENANGTSPYSHIKYLYDQSGQQHITKDEL